MRVITTTYVGATERRAVDELARMGAEGRDNGYVGSSNLSRSALVDGLEWNVRLSMGDTPKLISPTWPHGHTRARRWG